MKKTFILIIVLALCCCDKNANNRNIENRSIGQSEERRGEFENDLPVDLSKVLETYKLYKGCSGDKVDSILFSFVKYETFDDEIPLFEDTSFVIRLPEYKNSKIPFLAVAEEFYNNCSFAWNIWSNFEVWYRGATAGEIRSERQIIRSIRAINDNVIKDTELHKAAQIYKDSILLLISKGLDMWDDAHNPWNVRYSYSNAIEKKACRYYENLDEFQDRYNIMVEFAEGMGKDKYSRYLNSNENEQLSVMLSELNTCATFDEQCSLWRNWTNNKKSIGEDAWQVVVGKLLMESGKYNPNLNRIWISWRSICQLQYWGASRDSSIPNPFYNRYRKMCYNSCLKRIEGHPDDVFAMNCAASLAGNPNVIRMGDFTYGNDAVIDAIQMMPERIKIDEMPEDEAEDYEDEE